MICKYLLLIIPIPCLSVLDQSQIQNLQDKI